jgi:tetratricopeptide (TPR) repeat protein
MHGSWAQKLIGLAVIIVASAAPLLVFAQTGGVEGHAKGEDGNPLVGYTILIERQEMKWSSHVKTGKKGEFTHIGLMTGDYKFTLMDPNGRTIFYVTKHVGMGEPTEVDFDMARERALAQKEQQSNPEYQKKLEERTKDEKQFTGLKAIFDEGQALYGQQKYAEAAAMFEQALPLAKDKNVPVVLARLADTYHKAREYDKALDYYQKAIAATPNEAGLHNNLGSLYADMGKVPEAQAEFQKAAELDPPGASRVYYNMGVIMYNKGRMDEAAGALKKATELDAHYADAYYLLAQALMGKATMSPDGKVIAVPGTVEALESYLKLEPNGRWSQGAKETLQLIQGTVQIQYKAPKKKKG